MWFVDMILVLLFCGPAAEALLNCRHMGILCGNESDTSVRCAMTGRLVMEMDANSDGMFTRTQLFFVERNADPPMMRQMEPYAPPDARLFSMDGIDIFVEVRHKQKKYLKNDILTVKKELANYEKGLTTKEQWIILTKKDLVNLSCSR